MNRNIFSVALCSLLLALSHPAHAQQPKKIPRIGVLNATNQPFQREALLQGLHELYYSEPA